MKKKYEVIREHCKKLFYKKTYAKYSLTGKKLLGGAWPYFKGKFIAILRNFCKL